MRIIKGAIHIHSLYSYDGEKSLNEIERIFRDRGVNFIFCTEHAETLEDPELASFLLECKSLSKDDFIIIPGLEFQCEDVEILGLNITRKLHFAGLEDLSEQIQANGGLAILAHPYKYNFKLSRASLEKLNGIEVWNCRYEGGSAPRISNINLLRTLNKEHIFAYAGLDFHNDQQNVKLYHYLAVEKLDLGEIVKTLKAGGFYIKSKRLKLDARANTSPCESILFSLLNWKYDLIKWGANICGRILRYLHIKPSKLLYKLVAFLEIC